MRRGLLIVILLLIALPCEAAISRVTGCQASATSCTISGFLPGDLSVGFAYRTSSTTHPTIGSGYVTIDCAAGANTNSSCTGYKFLNGNETTCGTWANATQVICEVYRGVDIQATLGPIGGHTTTGSSSATLNYNTITMTVASGSSWVVGFGGCAACTNADAAPSGMTLRSGTSITNIAGSDTNGGVTSWATTGVTITSGSWRSETLELLAAPATASLATLSNYIIRDDYYGCDNCENQETTGNNFILPLLGAIGANNHPMLFMSVWYVTSMPTVTITCTSGTSPGSWTQEAVFNDSGNTMEMAIYGVPNATAGCKQIEVAFGAAVDNVRFHFLEESQIAASSPVDVTTHAVQTSSVYQGGASLTTTQANDFVYQACEFPGSYADETQISGAWAASGESILASDGINAGNGISGIFQDQAFILTNAATVTPMFQTLQSGANTWQEDCLSVAYKTSSGIGTKLPSGAQAVSLYNYATNSVAAPGFTYTVLPTVSAVVVNELNDGNANPQATGISDALAATWWYKSSSTGTIGVPDFAGTCAPTTGLDFISMAGIPNGNSGETYILGLSNTLTGSATSCYDSSATVSTGSGLTTPAGFATQTGNSAPTQTGPTISPSTNGGLVLAGINQNNGPVTAITAPTNAILTCPTYTGQTDASKMCLGNAYQSIYYNISTASETWTWTDSLASSWGASAVHILTAPVFTAPTAVY